MVKALRAGQDAPPTVFEASGGCCTNSLHERLFYYLKKSKSSHTTSETSETTIPTYGAGSNQGRIVSLTVGCLDSASGLQL